MGESQGLREFISPSHLIHNVTDTDATIRFYCDVFGATVSDDMELESPALDAMLGRQGVRIRSTFIEAGGYRLHTIESLDQPRRGDKAPTGAIGLGGLAFYVNDLETLRSAALAAGAAPTEIYHVDLGDDVEHSARMLFINDPDGVRCELVEMAVTPAASELAEVSG
jgi:catechol 2,3-dioxygenase-like lactoylglutathione lyase family enzyme